MSRMRNPMGAGGRLGRPTIGSGARAQPVEGFGEDRGAVSVVAALLDVSQVSLVGLGVRRGGRVRLVLASWQRAARGVPELGDGCVGGKARNGLMPVAAPERHPPPRRRFAALGLTHWAGPDPAAAYGVATTHCSPLAPKTCGSLGRICRRTGPHALCSSCPTKISARCSLVSVSDPGFVSQGPQCLSKIPRTAMHTNRIIQVQMVIR